MRQPPQPGIAYPAEEAAEFLSWSKGALAKAAHDRRVPHHRIGAAISFTKDDIEEILADPRFKVPASTQSPAPARRTSRPRSRVQEPGEGSPLRARGGARRKTA